MSWMSNVLMWLNLIIKRSKHMVEPVADFKIAEHPHKQIPPRGMDFKKHPSRRGVFVFAMRNSDGMISLSVLGKARNMNYVFI